MHCLKDVTAWQFEYALPDGVKWAESRRYWKVCTEWAVPREDTAHHLHFSRFSAHSLVQSTGFVWKVHQGVHHNWAFLLFPNCWHFHRLVVAERLTDRTFSAAAKKGKISAGLALNSRQKCNNVWSFSAAFCAQCEDLSASRSFM